MIPGSYKFAFPFYINKGVNKHNMLLADCLQHWSTIVNIIVNSYFSHLTTICIWQNQDYNLSWQKKTVNFNVYMQINPMNLRQSFTQDVFNYERHEEHFRKIDICLSDAVKRLTVSIHQGHCEGFVVFQDDIPKFAKAFRAASVYSKWRSPRNRFLFVYNTEDQHELEYFEDAFFKNNVNILVISADFKNSTSFSLKTTKFVGSRYQQPQQLIELTQFNALSEVFNSTLNLFPSNKLQDLEGREIIVGAFDYRPFMAVDFNRQPQYYDYAEDNPIHLVNVDGTEIRIVHTFCELYNCTVQTDTSEKLEWGALYYNYTGEGLMGMVISGKTDTAMGGMYSWDLVYEVMDQTTFMGRSGITCLVPAPSRITSWTLLLRPFQLSLWLGVLGCLFVEFLSLLICRQFEQSLSEQLNSKDWWSSINFGCTTTFKIFISQTSTYVISSHTVRTMLFACYMIDIIITSIYSGGLASILTLPTLAEVADSVERMYRHNLTWTGSSYDWVFTIAPKGNDSNDPLYERLYNNYRIYSKELAREMAKTENIGFALEHMTYGHFGNTDFLTPTSLQRLKLMIDDIYYQFTVALVPRLWPHLPKLNDLILIWHSSGFDKYWEWKIVADYMNVNQQNQMEASKYYHDNGIIQLDMKNFAGLWILWIVGITLSILVFAGEYALYWLKQKI